MHHFDAEFARRYPGFVAAYRQREVRLLLQEDALALEAQYPVLRMERELQEYAEMRVMHWRRLVGAYADLLRQGHVLGAEDYALRARFSSVDASLLHSVTAARSR